MYHSKNKLASSLLLACGLVFLNLPAFAGDMDASAADAKFKMMDSDGDGRISRAEHAASAQKMFDQMDTNHDGQVTLAEMTAWQDSVSTHSGPAGKSCADKIKALDTNADGQLSTAEHATGSDAMFTKMDTDGDGYLSQSEFAAGHKMMKKDK